MILPMQVVLWDSGKQKRGNKEIGLGLKVGGKNEKYSKWMKVGRGWENEEIVRDVDEHVYAEKTRK